MPNLQLKTPDDGQIRCPKHVEFYNRIKLGYVVRLVGYLNINNTDSSRIDLIKWFDSVGFHALFV